MNLFKLWRDRKARVKNPSTKLIQTRGPDLQVQPVYPEDDNTLANIAVATLAWEALSSPASTDPGSSPSYDSSSSSDSSDFSSSFDGGDSGGGGGGADFGGGE